MEIGATCGRDDGHDLVWVYRSNLCRAPISYTSPVWTLALLVYPTTTDARTRI